MLQRKANYTHVYRSQRMTWQPMQTGLGGWQWGADDLPNGWHPVVSDDSQVLAPKQTTSYRASACCRWWITTCNRNFDSFMDAKEAAIQLARRQLEASADPKCIVPDPPAQPGGEK